MKQKITRWDNGKIQYIININNIGQRHGLCVRYKLDGSIYWIDNYINGKLFGLSTYKPYIGEIEQKYHL